MSYQSKVEMAKAQRKIDEARRQPSSEGEEGEEDGDHEDEAEENENDSDGLADTNHPTPKRSRR